MEWTNDVPVIFRTVWRRVSSGRRERTEKRSTQHAAYRVPFVAAGLTFLSGSLFASQSNWSLPSCLSRTPRRPIMIDLVSLHS